MKWIFVLTTLTSFSFATAQEINAKVSLNYTALTGSDAANVYGLGNAIRNYINDFQWTNGSFTGPAIPVTFEIYLLSASNGVYSAQAFIGSQRPIYNSSNMSPMVRIFDNAWQFNYTQGEPLLHNQFSFNPLTGFIDYYMYIVLGFDADSYSPMGGTKYFQDASNIVAQAQSSNYSEGWQASTSGDYSRYGLVTDLLSGNYDGFRTAFYNYEYNGIDMLTTQPDSAQAVIAAAMDTVVDIVRQSGAVGTLIRVFFNAKYQEIANALRGYPHDAILKQLARIDPTHRSAYIDDLKSVNR